MFENLKGKPCGHSRQAEGSAWPLSGKRTGFTKRSWITTAMRKKFIDSTNGTLLANPYNEFNRLIFFTSGRRRVILN